VNLLKSSNSLKLEFTAMMLSSNTDLYGGPLVPPTYFLIWFLHLVFFVSATFYFILKSCRNQIRKMLVALTGHLADTTHLNK